MSGRNGRRNGGSCDGAHFSKEFSKAIKRVTVVTSADIGGTAGSMADVSLFVHRGIRLQAVRREVAWMVVNCDAGCDFVGVVRGLARSLVVGVTFVVWRSIRVSIAKRRRDS